MNRSVKYSQEFLDKLENMLRGDPLLCPHFEKGDIHILPPDKAGDDPIWIDFTLKEYIQDFIKSRVNANLFGLRNRVDAQALRNWDDRVELIKVTEADEVLRPYFESELISWTNYPDKATFEMELGLPAPEIFLILGKITDLIEEKFDTPESKW
jgi:hypothetical protein